MQEADSKLIIMWAIIIICTIVVMALFIDRLVSCRHKEWNGCKCAKCGTTRDEGHEWIEGSEKVPIYFDQQSSGGYCYDSP